MSFNLVRFEDVRPQPWKNGGGVTREMLAWPTLENWLVRISVADIERDGPFSSFPGIKRSITVLHGGGMTLSEPVDIELVQGTPPFTFPGDCTPHCELINGPTQDLNAMFDQESGIGRLQRLWKAGEDPEVVWRMREMPRVSDMRGIFARDGLLLRAGRQRLEMPPMSLAWTDGSLFDVSVSSPPLATWAFHYSFNVR